MVASVGMPVPTSEIVRAVAVLGPHATARTVAGAVGMEESALRERCAAEGIDLLGLDRPTGALPCRDLGSRQDA